MTTKPTQLKERLGKLLMSALAIGLTAGSAQAFLIRNNTSWDMLVDVHYSGNHLDSRLIPARTTLDYAVSNIGVHDVFSRTPGALDFDWEAKVPVPFDGSLTISAEDHPERGPTVRTFHLDSFTASGGSYSTSDVTWDDAERNVRFLVSADCQFYGDEIRDGCPSDCVADAYDAYVVMNAMNSMRINNPDIRGMIMAGDLTHNAWTSELREYQREVHGYGLDAYGMERYWYDGLGNHDYCDGGGNSCEEEDALFDLVTNRKHNAAKARRGSPHYSWDWHDVHFVQLNLVPTDEPIQGWPLLDPYDALTFLTGDLADHVGDSCRPVVLIHHIGFDLDFSIDEWSEAQRLSLWNAIADYNVVAILTGHHHYSASRRYRWDWLRPAGTQIGPPSIPTFVCGGGWFGVWMDVTIDAEGGIYFDRYEFETEYSCADGAPFCDLYDEYVTPHPELWVDLYSPFSWPDLSRNYPAFTVTGALAYLDNISRPCETETTTIMVSPGVYNETFVENRPAVLANSNPGLGEVVIGRPP